MSSKSPAGGEQWASRIGVILAVAGSAVGLGNFLRFPGQAAQHGGGAFMIPYFISLLVLGIPLCWAEWTMGRYGGLNGFNSAPGIYSTLWKSRWARYFGAIALVVPLVIYMYYVVIEAWCLGYAIQYLTGSLMKEGSNAEVFQTHFDEFVGADANGALFQSRRLGFLVILAGTFIANFVLIYRGVSKGIETFCRVAMPAMAVLAFIVLIRVLTLGTPDPSKPDQSVLGGLGFMWNPDFSHLSDPQMWLAAAGQIFFTLSVGFGIVINYASYLKRKDDVVLSGVTACSVNEFFEVCFGGLITLPAAFIFLGAAAGSQGTFDLGFKALPNVFAQMPGGRIIGFLWFIVLFIAAITSSISMLQPVIAFFEEGFGLKRHASAAMLGLVSALGCGFVLYFSEGMVALDTLDFWVGSVLIIMLALIQAIIYGWCFGIERGAEEAHVGAHMRIPHFVQLMLKYVVPVYLITIFAMFCWNNVPSQDIDVATLDANVVAGLQEGELGTTLLATLAAHDIEAPAGSKLVSDGSDWRIVDADDALLIKLSGGEDGVALQRHKAGYYENIVNNPVALASVLFIAIILAFLLLLVHIAGRRWETEGRLTYP
ncbi:sodium-dependent transporter [Lacipirellula limnantheis]|uniref:Sodium:neurotransmitter symporter family protein n=1 Tax=Lacipirellula limnantheis TaxID=2528024 RepID=A0A517TZM4_9BACT|nr:sodium-dependent transporter [Lacipirellula limnantheis]QDT73812.1 Sodium:neurotransmitter symporter family protein [Lacipirellula limnantheis]